MSDNNKESEVYNYNDFLKDAEVLCTKSLNTFKFCHNDLLDISYLKGTVNMNENILMEIEMVYSETYMLPVLYFQIYKDGKFYNFADYIKEYPPLDEEVMKNAIVSKENHPLNGRIYNYVHLCKFYDIIKADKDIENVLIFWLSYAFQIFNINIRNIVHNL